MALPAAAGTVLCALVVLTVSRPSAWACLLCFTSHTERLRICQTFAGMEGPELEKCEAAFTAAFTGLLDTEISEETTLPSSRVLGVRGYAEGGTREAWRHPGRGRRRQVDADGGAETQEMVRAGGAEMGGWRLGTR